MQQAGNSNVVPLPVAVEAELLNMCHDEIKLRLEVVAETDDFRATLLRPAVGDFL